MSLSSSLSSVDVVDAVKVKGTITWVGVADGVSAEVHLYDRLFTEPQPDAGGRDFRSVLNPDSHRVVQAIVEPAAAALAAETRLQFERHGWFVADRVGHKVSNPVFNRIAGLRNARRE